MNPNDRKSEDRTPEAPVQADYNDLKRQAGLLADYQNYYRDAIEARDEAARDADLESRRIADAEAKVRALVVKLNLTPTTAEGI